MLLCLLKKVPEGQPTEAFGGQFKTNQKKYKTLSIEIFCSPVAGLRTASQPEYLFKPECSEDDTSHQRHDAKRHQALLCLREFLLHILYYFVWHGDRVNLGHIRRVMHFALDILGVPLFNPYGVALLLHRYTIVEPHRIALHLGEIDAVMMHFFLNHGHILDAFT